MESSLLISYEVSGSCGLFDFSEPTVGNYKGFTWQVFNRGKSVLPTPDLMPSEGIAISENNCSQGLRPIWLNAAFFSIPVPGAFIWRSLKKRPP